MRTMIATLLIAALLVVLGAGAVIYAGMYDVAATAPHWRVTEWLLETARTRSIKAQASGIPVPAGLDDPARLIIGVEHYAAHCAVCHGAPGVPKGDIGRGLSPPPPDLAKTAPLYNPAELFWIVKHGIKMTGMPRGPITATRNYGRRSPLSRSCRECRSRTTPILSWQA